MRNGWTIPGLMLAVVMAVCVVARAESPLTGPAQSNQDQIESWQIENWRSDGSYGRYIDPLTIVPIERPGRINVTGGLVWPQAAVSLPGTDHANIELVWSNPPVVPLPPAAWGGLMLGALAINIIRKQRSGRSKARLF